MSYEPCIQATFPIRMVENSTRSIGLLTASVRVMMILCI